MSLIGHTAGGSPVFMPRVPSLSRSPKGKTMYSCSRNDGHRLSVKQAKRSGYMCTNCGAELRVRKQKLSELSILAESLGFSISPKEFAS